MSISSLSNLISNSLTQHPDEFLEINIGDLSLWLHLKCIRYHLFPDVPPSIRPLTALCWGMISNICISTNWKNFLDINSITWNEYEIGDTILKCCRLLIIDVAHFIPITRSLPTWLPKLHRILELCDLIKVFHASSLYPR